MKVFLQGNGISQKLHYSMVSDTYSMGKIACLESVVGNNEANYKGLIDDVRIYDRALSAAEVQALFNLGQ